MDEEVERVGLTILKVITTLCLGLFLGYMFIQCLAYEIIYLQLENEFLLDVVIIVVLMMIFYKPLREAVFGTDKFIKFICTVLLTTGIWYVITLGINLIGYGLVHDLLHFEINSYQTMRISAILAFNVWYQPYKKLTSNKQKEEIEEVNVEESVEKSVEESVQENIEEEKIEQIFLPRMD